MYKDEIVWQGGKREEEKSKTKRYENVMFSCVMSASPVERKEEMISPHLLEGGEGGFVESLKESLWRLKGKYNWLTIFEEEAGNEEDDDDE